MTFLHNRALFIFRQDLRTIDNTWLNKAISLAKEVLPVFIFDTTILSEFPDHDKRLGFLVDALLQLRSELKALWWDLITYHGKSTEIIPQLVQQLQCDALIRNKSYWENSRKRDAALQDRASWENINYYMTPDYLLVEPKNVEQRKVFTPFYKLWMQVEKQQIPAPAPQKVNFLQGEYDNQRHLSLDTPKDEILTTIWWADQYLWKPLDWREIVKKLSTSSYDELRNFPGTEWTSRLSPHLAFWTISVREVFQAAVKNTVSEWVIIHDETSTVTMDKKIFKDSFISELARREFWQHIAYYFPTTREIEFQEKRQNLKRVNNKERFEHRKNGTTGYPIVDAAMRQLKEENWMHWRTRMIVASFLTKDLLIDRRWGEEHFKNYLLDYDKAVNMWNWQRSASVWADPKPLRIFSPLLQSKRFDPEAVYIRKWIPELKNEPLAAIHDPLKYKLNYIVPVVDHSIMQRIAKVMYKKEDISGLIS